MSVSIDGDQELRFVLPDAMLAAVAERVAALVAVEVEKRSESPWLDFDAAAAYLGFSRDRLYKLTAARAIPYRKKGGGQGLLFRRDELDRWVETAYESTGCSPHVELWSTTT